MGWKKYKLIFTHYNISYVPIFNIYTYALLLPTTTTSIFDRIIRLGREIQFHKIRSIDVSLVAFQKIKFKLQMS